MRNVRQDSPDYLRRWFFDDNFDLIAWYTPDGELFGFQLCYDKEDGEKALMWLPDRGLSHHRVDSGEQNPFYNRSPMLTDVDGRPGMGGLLASFRTVCAGVPGELAEAVERKICEYGRLPTEF